MIEFAGMLLTIKSIFETIAILFLIGSSVSIFGKFIGQTIRDRSIQSTNFYWFKFALGQSIITTLEIMILADIMSITAYPDYQRLGVLLVKVIIASLIHFVQGQSLELAKKEMVEESARPNNAGQPHADH